MPARKRQRANKTEVDEETLQKKQQKLAQLKLSSIPAGPSLNGPREHETYIKRQDLIVKWIGDMLGGAAKKEYDAFVAIKRCHFYRRKDNGREWVWQRFDPLNDDFIGSVNYRPDSLFDWTLGEVWLLQRMKDPFPRFQPDGSIRCWVKWLPNEANYNNYQFVGSVDCPVMAKEDVLTLLLSCLKDFRPARHLVTWMLENSDDWHTKMAPIFDGRKTATLYIFHDGPTSRHYEKLEGGLFFYNVRTHRTYTNKLWKLTLGVYESNGYNGEANYTGTVGRYFYYDGKLLTVRQIENAPTILR